MRAAAPHRPAAVALAATAAIGLLGAPGDAAADASPAYQQVMAAEAASRTLCEADPGRVFVRHRLGSECVAFQVTQGHALHGRAVIFLDGDIPRERMSASAQSEILRGQMRALQAMADRYRLPFVAISRPGVLGSSGHHGWRRRPAEALSIDAAVDALKQRLKFETVVLAGQSGGATMVASLLTLGRRDVACAVLGSGNLAVVDLYMQRLRDTAPPVTGQRQGQRQTRDVVERTFYDPARHVPGIVADAARRVFVIGDPADSRTPFDQQQRFAASLRRAGHHAEVLPIVGSGPESHGATYAVLPAAGQCALAMPDAAIADGARARSQAQARRAAGAPPAAAAAAAAANQ